MWRSHFLHPHFGLCIILTHFFPRYHFMKVGKPPPSFLECREKCRPIWTKLTLMLSDSGQSSVRGMAYKAQTDQVQKQPGQAWTVQENNEKNGHKTGKMNNGAPSMTALRKLVRKFVSFCTESGLYPDLLRALIVPKAHL